MEDFFELLELAVELDDLLADVQALAYIFKAFADHAGQFFNAVANFTVHVFFGCEWGKLLDKDVGGNQVGEALGRDPLC